MSLENLIVLCGKHHDIIDERADIYTTECLTSMKNDHEEKVENTTDRSWIKFPNLIIELGGLEATTINYWIDRTERCQVYTDRKLVIAKTVMDIYLDINRLCNLYDLVEQYPESPAKNLMQDYVKLDKNKINLDLQTNRSALVHVLARMAEIPEITF